MLFKELFTGKGRKEKGTGVMEEIPETRNLLLTKEIRDLRSSLTVCQPRFVQTPTTLRVKTAAVEQKTLQSGRYKVELSRTRRAPPLT